MDPSEPIISQVKDMYRSSQKSFVAMVCEINYTTHQFHHWKRNDVVIAVGCDDKAGEKKKICA